VIPEAEPDARHVPPPSTETIAGYEIVQAPEDIQVTGRAVHAAVRHLAHLTGVLDLCVSSATAPFGYWMELPAEGDLLPSNEAHLAHLPAVQQVLLRRGGWQLLATLSGQFDSRIQGPPFFPADSTWAISSRQGTLEDDIACCGCSVHADGRVQIDLASLFYLMTEHLLLGPCVAELVQRIAARRAAASNVLPATLQLFTMPSGHQ